MLSRPNPEVCVAIVALVLRLLQIATTMTRVMRLAITNVQEGLIPRIPGSAPRDTAPPTIAKDAPIWGVGSAVLSRKYQRECWS